MQTKLSDSVAKWYFPITIHFATENIRLDGISQEGACTFSEHYLILRAQKAPPLCGNIEACAKSLFCICFVRVLRVVRPSAAKWPRVQNYKHLRACVNKYLAPGLYLSKACAKYATEVVRFPLESCSHGKHAGLEPPSKGAPSAPGGCARV